MLRPWNTTSVWILIGSALLVCTGEGCGNGTHEGLPPVDVGRRSLEAALGRLARWRKTRASGRNAAPSRGIRHPMGPG